MQNTVIWFIGANASGKSTLSANVQYKLRKLYSRGSDPGFDFVHENGKVLLTRTSGLSCNLGKFNHPKLYQDPIKTNACCGTDTLPKKELISRALEVSSYAPNGIKFIFVEGIMATRQWVDLFPSGYRILLVLLDISIDHCMLRLIQRRSEKKGLEQSEVLESLTEKTVANVTGKIAGFRKMFDDLKLRRDITSLRFDIDENFDIEYATSVILKQILLTS